MNTRAAHIVRRERIAIVLLTLAMWATRSHHFGSILHLPDASWAAFFIAGAMGARIRVPLWLVINAGIIDYLALQGGVSSYCVTPAYAFLVPTYLTLWASGRWSAMTFSWNVMSLARTAGALSLGVAGAFIVSNASFYALAGYFEKMSMLQYTNSVAAYFPHFLESTALDTIAAGVAAFAWQHFRVLIGSNVAKR
jgi:hypothetical protein